MNSKDYGIPQSRERIFLISILKTEDEPDPYYEFPKPIELDKCVEDVLEDNVDEKYYMSQDAVDKYITHLQEDYPKEDWVVENTVSLW